MRHLLYPLLALAAATGFASAQSTSYTTPVGYVSITLAGNAASNEFGADTYAAPTLLRELDYAAESNAEPIGDTVTFAGTSTPTGLDGTSYLEITSGSREGWWSTIESSTNNSITTVDDFPAGLGNIKVAVRKFHTIQSFLGENTPGLGVNDEVQVLDPVNQTVKAVKYVGSEWQDVVLETNEDNAIIYPGTAVKIRVFGASDIEFDHEGEVKVTKTEIDIYPNTNWVGSTRASGGTFGTHNFGPQMIQEDFDPETTPAADYLETISASQVATSFNSIGGVVTGVVSEADASGEPLDAGTGVGFFRDPAAPGSVIVIPPQPIGTP
jgi:hypothetical protein